MRHLTLISLILLPSLSLADKADELIEILELENDWYATRTEILESVTDPDGYLEDLLTGEQKDIHTEYVLDMEELIDKYFSWTNLKLAVKSSINKTFTASELNEIVSFLNSPAGEKYLTSSESIQAIVMETLSENMEGFSEESQSLFADYNNKISEKLN